MIQYPRYKRHRFSSFQVIIAGFAAVDLVGALLLMLPIAAQQRCVTPFHEALFTSTSALCVTGLVVQDTGSYWSAFGQSVILLLIQIGGLGVITVGAAFALLSGRKISLKQRSTMQEATAAPQMGGIVRLTGFILRITALFELAGAALLLPTFCADYGLRGIWYALFHSISAFCNAGFDLLGTEGAKFVSLTRYAGDPLLTTVIAALIVFGGLGFLTWEDICTYRLDFHPYEPPAHNQIPDAEQGDPCHNGISSGIADAVLLLLRVHGRLCPAAHFIVGVPIRYTPYCRF